MVGAITPAPAREAEIEEIELQLLLEAIARAAGIDYREYDPNTLRRRVSDRMRAEQVATISALQDRVLHDKVALDHFVAAMAGGHRELFYDPGFFLAFRLHVVPLLQTYSFVRLWLPEAGAGEDAWSLAALLDEVGLLSRCIIYATSFSEVASGLARRGEYAIDVLRAVRSAVRNAGFKQPLESFAALEGGRVRFAGRLRDGIMFASCDPSSTASINEFHAIVARNVFPLFSGAGQYRLHRVAYQSLARLGFLCLGKGESVSGTVHERAYRQVTPDHNIYRRMR